jgi:hypothetical protein
VRSDFASTWGATGDSFLATNSARAFFDKAFSTDTRFYRVKAD